MSALAQPGSLLPVVSVIIPCYNQGRFLADAIQSVLQQTYNGLEIIVVDDGSDDNTPRVASAYSAVRSIRQTNQGLSAARNAGVAVSTGEYLVFLDADDRLLPGALQAGLDCLTAHPECAFAVGHFRFITADGSPLPVQGWTRVDGGQYSAFLRGEGIAMGATVTYRRGVLTSVMGFNTSLRACEDYDLYLRITRTFPVCYHDSLVAEYRQHDRNMSRNPGLMLRSALSALRSQRQYLTGNGDHIEAYKAGIRYWRGQYGPALQREFLARLRAGRVDAMGTFLTLVRYQPRGFPEGIYRLFSKMWRKFRGRGLASHSGPI